MKIAIEVFCALCLAFNLMFMVLGLFPSLARHPSRVLRLATQWSLLNVYQLQSRSYTNTVWFNAIQLVFVLVWAVACGIAFGHGWTFVGVSLAVALFYGLYSQTLITFKPLTQYCY